MNPERTFLPRVLTLLALIAIPVASGGAQAPEARMVRDVVYGHVDGLATVYDVVTPEGTPNGAGVAFVVSGGFLSSRDLQEMLAPVAQPLLDVGFTLFYLRHPSTPRYLATEIYESVRSGMDHILANASLFGVDPSRVGVMGMSTGGLLALLLALDVPPADTLPRPAAVVAYMPVVDFRTVVGNVQATPSVGIPPELAPDLSPVDFISPDDPPVLFIHGDQDFIVPLEENSRLMSSLMEAGGLSTELVVVAGGHELFFGESKAIADVASVAWFERYLLHER